MMTLVYGGAASGKSEYAEALAEAAFDAGGGTLWYLATMTASDPESRARIQKHRDRRAEKSYRTAECGTAEALTAFVGTCAGEDVLLLDDVGNLVAGALFPPEAEWTGEPALLPEEELREETERLIAPFRALKDRCRDVIVVTNDVFGSSLPYEAPPNGVQNYQKLLAELNCSLAQFSDRVCEVVAGLPNDLKGGSQP